MAGSSGSPGASRGSPGLRRSTNKALAAPVVSDVKTVGRTLNKATEAATTKLREVWHKISELGAAGKLPQSVIDEIFTSLDNLTGLVAQQHSEILKAVKLARGAAGAMSTVADPEENETTTVDLDPDTHGSYRTAEERMNDHRTSTSVPISPKLGVKNSQGSPAQQSPQQPGSAKGSPSSSVARKLDQGSVSPTADARANSSDPESAETPLGGTVDSPTSLDEEERRARETLQRIAATRQSAAGSASNGDAQTNSAPQSDGHKAKETGHRRAKSVPSPLLTVAEDSGGADNDVSGDTNVHAEPIVRVTSESGSPEVMDNTGGRQMDGNGYLRSEPKATEVVDAATEAMRKKMKKKSRERFLKGCEDLDEAAKKEYAARRATEVQRNPWALVQERVRKRSLSDPTLAPPGPT